MDDRTSELMRTFLFPVFAMLVALLHGEIANAQLGQITTRPAKLAHYANDGATLGFVAAAVTELGACARPLEFSELSRGSVQILEIICEEGEDTRFARLTFIRVNEPGKVTSFRPFRMEFLP